MQTVTIIFKRFRILPALMIIRRSHGSTQERSRSQPGVCRLPTSMHSHEHRPFGLYFIGKYYWCEHGDHTGTPGKDHGHNQVSVPVY